MIARKSKKKKQLLSKTTLTTLRALAKHGSDLDLEDFVERVAMMYIAQIRDTDFIEEQDYLYIKNTNFDCECPNCHEMLELDLKELVANEL